MKKNNEPKKYLSYFRFIDNKWKLLDKLCKLYLHNMSMNIGLVTSQITPGVLFDT